MSVEDKLTSLDMLLALDTKLMQDKPGNHTQDFQVITTGEFKLSNLEENTSTPQIQHKIKKTENNSFNS